MNNLGSTLLIMSAVNFLSAIAMAFLAKKRGVSAQTTFILTMLGGLIVGFIYLLIKSRKGVSTEQVSYPTRDSVMDTQRTQHEYFQKRADLEQRTSYLERLKAQSPDMNYDYEIENLRSELNSLRY